MTSQAEMKRDSHLLWTALWLVSVLSWPGIRLEHILQADSSAFLLPVCATKCS